ncbi:serine--tRNA ligase [Heliophilum fasciatum]|uniref:Serine--tRNA ligase n=1 Tax=Heliophilum fasciatum TaxID=35700 RepID=A0A4R2RPI1_9FIRM|nr:serine--tRNA ligase [Heliophilum fasciatum]MCW2277578.1 seryl-tRNA synthetase [Heliophilum fasciatum]TCP65133.1 seryl-tRNA synthetase [Heliophilum fasciatum]
MLDIKFVRANPALVQEALDKRGAKISLDDFLAMDQKRRAILVEVEGLKAERNRVSQEIARLKKAKEDAENLVVEMRAVGDRIKVLDEELAAIEGEMENVLYYIPNIPHASVPVGVSEADNPVVRTWGTPKPMDFTPKPHWDLGESLDILDFQRGAKITGARFTIYKGLGARLERSIINLMLNTHTDRGYREILPPFIVNRQSMMGTGQLPKFAEDMFGISGTEYFLIPTAEVPVTNMYGSEILDGDQLPIHHCAYSACFRAEAGAAGRDTRGLIRQHQFNKVELVKFTKPEDSYAELEKLTADAEHILQLLELPYRVITLCTGDMGFSSAKTYDIEVWLPSFETYREISSCSNFEDFQARRAGIRYRSNPKAKPEFVHTLNGSGLAIGRTVAAVLENYQQADGSVIVPEALRPYMGVDVIRPE